MIVPARTEIPFRVATGTYCLFGLIELFRKSPCGYEHDQPKPKGNVVTLNDLLSPTNLLHLKTA